MRVVIYSHTAFFEPILSLTQVLAPEVELHLLLEVGPQAWRAAAFDAARDSTPAGIVPADAVVAAAFPPALRRYWKEAASFHLVVHHRRQSLHPASIATSLKAIRFIEVLRPDIVHIDDVDVSLRLPIVLPTLRRRALVLSVHDPTPHLGEANWRKRLARTLAYRRASHFIVHGRRQAQRLIEVSGVDVEKITAVPFGSFDLLRVWGRSDPPRKSSPLILFFGRLSRYKGLDVLFHASRIVSRRIPGVRYIVAGKAVDGYVPPDPPGEVDIEMRLRYIPNAELAELFQLATLVVCPYVDASQSGVVMTSYGFGKPVIASDAGGLAEYVLPGETGLVVPPGDARALAEAIVHLIEQPELMDRMCNNIEVLRKTRFSWQAAAEATLQVYRRVLDTSPVSSSPRPA